VFLVVSLYTLLVGQPSSVDIMITSGDACPTDSNEVGLSKAKPNRYLMPRTVDVVFHFRSTQPTLHEVIEGIIQL